MSKTRPTARGTGSRRPSRPMASSPSRTGATDSARRTRRVSGRLPHGRLVAERLLPAAVALYPHARDLQVLAAVGLMLRPHDDGVAELEQASGQQLRRPDAAERGLRDRRRACSLVERPIAVRADERNFIGGDLVPLARLAAHRRFLE